MKNVLLLIGTSLILSSCATIFTGTKQSIHVSSIPHDAQVSINGNSLGKTPFTINKNRRLRKEVLTLTSDSETKDIQLNKNFNAVTLLNLLNPLLIPVDLLNGACVSYDKEFHFYSFYSSRDKQRQYMKDHLEQFFYVITETDTFFCKPQVNTLMMSNNLKFQTLLSNEVKKINHNNVLRYKTLKLGNETEIQIFEAKYTENKKDKRFVEILLEEGNYSLTKEFNSQHTGFTMRTNPVTGTANYSGGGSYEAPVYKLYDGDEYVETLSSGDCENIINQHFSKNNELIKYLEAKRYNFNKVEDFVYSSRQNVY